MKTEKSQDRDLEHLEISGAIFTINDQREVVRLDVNEPQTDDLSLTERIECEYVAPSEIRATSQQR